MSNIMLDLETLGVKSGSAIISIGACVFDSSGIRDEFHTCIDIDSNLKCGRTVCASTLKWWMNQSVKARSIFDRQGVDLTVALYEFAEWCNKNSVATVWGNGSDFDNAILSDAYSKQSIATPWPFWGNRCFRTMVNVLPPKELERVGVHHDALDDAKTQALHLIKILGSSSNILD